MKQPSISVIIPTLEGDPLTLQSVPADIEVLVVREGNRAQARNLGAERSSGDILVFCDDDIHFSQEFFFKQIEDTDPGTIMGLTDFDFDLLLTRFMIVYRTDFETLGGFNGNLNHMEDTEFCLNALSHGINIRSIPRNKVYHEEHESSGQGRWPTLRNILYLAVEYPRYIPRLLRGIIRK